MLEPWQVISYTTLHSCMVEVFYVKALKPYLFYNAAELQYFSPAITTSNNNHAFDGTFYKQILGCPMGSPVSAILANLEMEYLEERALNNSPRRPKWC